MTRPPPLPSALALALGMALAAPAGAQSFEDLQTGPIAPCLQDHFDPDRYQADLAALGWVPAPDILIDAVIEILAHGFLPVTHAAPAEGSDDTEARLELAREAWRLELDQRTALLQGDAVLYLRGQVQPNRFRRVDCWLVTPDAAFVNGLIAQGEAEVSEGAEVAVGLGPFVVSDQAEAVVIASRYPNPPGPVWALSTQMAIRPAQP
jgi:hypothetical protein